MSNQWCDTCGGLVDRIGLRPQGVRFCECRETIEKIRAENERLRKEIGGFLHLADLRACMVATADENKRLRAALNTAMWAMQQPLDQWKGECEQKALNEARAALKGE